MLKAGLYALLSGESTITDIVADRIEPTELSIGQAMPALTFRSIGGSSDPTLTSSGMQKVRIQLDCFGSSDLQAETLREAVRVFFNGFQGALNDGTYLQNADLIQSPDSFQNAARQFVCMIEFRLLFVFPD